MSEPGPERPHRLVILFDVDNTLLDNDRVRDELEAQVVEIVGDDLNDRFWEIYEQVRTDLDHVSFPETLERFGRVCDDVSCVDALSELLYDFPFRADVYPGALPALEHASRIGLPVIVTDGDQFFQRYKVRSAGLAGAVDGRVLIYVHKEQQTDDISRHFPAAHYVMLDDKGRILTAMKRRMGDRLTTVHVLQGKYAEESPEIPPDRTLDSIADFASLTAGDLGA